MVLILFIFNTLFSDGVEPIGSGTLQDPYQVEILDNLLWISSNPEYWDCHYEQITDIDAFDTRYWNNGGGFSPIGEFPNTFTGSYNGQNYNIDNLYIERDSEYDQGFFGNVDNVIISNLHVTNVEISGYGGVGGLIAYIDNSQVHNCSSSGIVNGYIAVGGLVGQSRDSEFTDCFSTSIVTGDQNSGSFGGWFHSTSISCCYSNGSIFGGSRVGGFIGELNNSVISCSYSSGDVCGNSLLGGFVGYNNSVISNCYSTCSVNGEIIIGGFIGHNSEGEVINCYSVGNVSGGEYFVGGFVGYDDNSVYSNSIWNVETSNQVESDGGIGLITSEMQSYATYIDAGWDFIDETENGIIDYWGINPDENSGYPFLGWQGFIHDPVSVIDASSIAINPILYNSYPNPFNPNTNISFSIPFDTYIKLTIYNSKGQKVKTLCDKFYQKGEYTILWDGEDSLGRSLSSGVYLYELSLDSNSVSVKSCVLIK